MSVYTYFTTDLMTNEILGEIPLDSVDFSLAISNVGHFSGNAPLGGSELSPLQIIQSTIPRRTALWVDRDGVLVWGGIIWTRTWDSKTKTLALGGNDFMSYFDHRVIKDNLTFDGIEQLLAVRQILQYAMSKPGSWAGLELGTETSLSVLPTPFAYIGTEERVINQEIQQLAQRQADPASTDIEAGFEYITEFYYDEIGKPHVRLRLGYPDLGAEVTDNLFEFQLYHSDNILDYTWPEDGTITANDVIARGAGTQSQTDPTAANTTATAEAVQADDSGVPTFITTGEPLLEMVSNYQNISDLGILHEKAVSDLSAHQGLVTIPTINVHGAKDPIFGSYTYGDVVRLRIMDERFPDPGIDLSMRIVGMEVKPRDKGNADIETVAITLAPLLPGTVTLLDIITPIPATGPGQL